VPKAITFDFSMLTLAPDAAAQQVSASCILGMSVGDVTNTVISFA